MKNNPEEQILINNILQGGREAEKSFSLLMQMHGPALYRQIYRMMKNEMLAKDVLQNVYIKIWTGIAQFRGDASFFSWSYRIAYNESLNELKKEKNRFSYDLNEAIVSFLPSHQFGNQISEIQMSNWLNEAIQSLPEKQAMVFQMKYFDDLKFSEIAKITNISEGGLKANYHHATQKIESFLKSKLNFIQH